MSQKKIFLLFLKSIFHTKSGKLKNARDVDRKKKERKRVKPLISCEMNSLKHPLGQGHLKEAAPVKPCSFSC